MIGQLNHVAIVVPDLDKASHLYRECFGATVSDPTEMKAHGVITVFVELDNTKIELLHPLGDNSPVQKFLEKHPEGGMHHICYEVDDIYEACLKLKEQGLRILGDKGPTVGAHGKKVAFLHPKDALGTLIELEEK